MTYRAEVLYRGAIDPLKDAKLGNIAKRLGGEWTGSGTDTTQKGRQQFRHTVFEFSTRGRASRFLKTVRKKVDGLSRMFIRESPDG